MWPTCGSLGRRRGGRHAPPGRSEAVSAGSRARRVAGRSRADPSAAAAAATAALYGPLHGGANEQVLRMLNDIGSVENVPAYIERVKRGEIRLMGFGHRVYKNFDPRATLIKT